MAHRRKSSLVLPTTTLDKRPASSTSSASLHATVHAGLSAALTAALSPIHSRAPSPAPGADTGASDMDPAVVGFPSRERTYSDELESASMNDDAPIPDLAHLAAPFADFLAAPPTPGTPSKLDPDFKPQYGSRSPSVGVAGAVGVGAGALRTRSYIRTLLRRLTAFLASTPQSPLPLKSQHRLRDASLTHRRLPVPLPLRRRATALALLVLLALCAWIVLFSGSTSKGQQQRGALAPGGPYRAWANDGEDVNLDELDPEERRRLLSSAAFRVPQTKPNRTRPKMSKGKGRTKAKHPAAPGSNGGSSSTTSHGGLVMTPSDELAALTSFLLNAGSNTLLAAEEGSDGVDPMKPLDPSRVLAFDPARMGVQKARAELDELKTETWAVNPVVVFGKVRLFSFLVSLFYMPFLHSHFVTVLTLRRHCSLARMSGSRHAYRSI